MNNYSEFKIVINDLLLVKKHIQHRFPKSKKKRIRKKWFKNNNNWKFIETSKIIYDQDINTIYMTKKDYEKITNKYLNLDNIPFNYFYNELFNKII